MWCDLYNFTIWEPAKTNEADYYDFVEWQTSYYPYTGITGLGKLRNVLWVYTPTAIIPMQYVGLPKVVRVMEEGIMTHVGNTFPWTLVVLDNVHFFYDGIEKTFFAFDGQQLTPIGEPIRQYMADNLNTTSTLAQKMYGYVDVDHREVWWVFPSTASSGDFDRAVVFNYRYKRWFTASVENVHSFCGGVRTGLKVSELVGVVGDLTGTCGNLGLLAGTTSPRIYGSASGAVLREELSTDAFSALMSVDDPVLETPDFHYGDIRTVKENGFMLVNATWDDSLAPDAGIDVYAAGRAYLGDEPTWPSTAQGQWTPGIEDDMLSYLPVPGRVLRYKFVCKNARGLKFSAYSDAVNVQIKAEK